MTMRREAGWYWCVMDGALFPIYYSGGKWWKGGYTLNEEPRIVSGRIPTPEETADTYLQAADEMLVVAGIGTAEPEDDLGTAKRKLGELIDWHVAVALDERVNGGYRLCKVVPVAEDNPDGP